MIEFNEEIMRKVEQKEKEATYFNRCLEAYICPTCGEKLESRITNDENLPDEVFQCVSCKFKYRQPWA